MNKSLFIMVSPSRNEEDFLPRVIESVNKSSVRPALWVIVDDNSTDRTPKILQDASKKHRYIKTLRLNNRRDRSSFNISYVLKTGFDYAMQLSQENKINWEYIMVLDADTIVEYKYFENIISKMHDDPKIGIASGNIYILKKGKIKNIKFIRNSPFGTARILRKNCFNQIGGHPLTYSADAVSEIKANLKGWKTVRFREPRAYQLRETFSAKGLWNGYYKRGKIAYYLCLHPLHILIIMFSRMFQPKFYFIIPYYMGYLENMIRKAPKTKDKEIIEYFKHEWMYTLQNIIRKLVKQIIFMSGGLFGGWILGGTSCGAVWRAQQI